MLSNLQHPNIVTYYDYWDTKLPDSRRQMVIITELMVNGTLKEYALYFEPVFPEHRIRKAGYEILSGLNYLHSRNPVIIHRDLKCDNIFVSENGVAKIGDLGLAGLKVSSGMNSNKGTLIFQAPEIHLRQKYNESVDLYAFGMSLPELVLRDILPYSECPNIYILLDNIVRGIKPEGLQKVNNGTLRQIIELCLSLESKQRPKVKDLLDLVFFTAEADQLLGVRPRRVQEPDSSNSSNSSSSSNSSKSSNSSNSSTRRDKVSEEDQLSIKALDDKIEDLSLRIMMLELEQREAVQLRAEKMSQLEKKEKGRDRGRIKGRELPFKEESHDLRREVDDVM